VDTPEDRPDEAADATTGAATEPTTDATTDADAEGWNDGADLPVTAARPGNLLLGIVGALAVSALGVVLWGILYATVKREFVGLAVLIGLLNGYALRELSRRSTILTRILASVVTALACVAGTVVGEVAYTSAKLHAAFWKLLGDVWGDWWTLLRHRTGLQFAIYAAALVIAFLSAGPSQATRSAAAAAAADDAAHDDDADLTETADPAMLPDEG
jgi:hypothetical protein